MLVIFILVLCVSVIFLVLSYEIICNEAKRIKSVLRKHKNPEYRIIIKKYADEHVYYFVQYKLLWIWHYYRDYTEDPMIFYSYKDATNYINSRKREILRKTTVESKIISSDNL